MSTTTRIVAAAAEHTNCYLFLHLCIVLTFLNCSFIAPMHSTNVA